MEMKGNENINLLFQNVHNLKYLMSIIKIDIKFIKKYIRKIIIIQKNKFFNLMNLKN